MSEHPRVVATILLNDCGDLVVPAIESAIDQVDTVCCIDTTRAGDRPNGTIALARKVARGKYVGHKLLIADRATPRDGQGRATFRRGWNGSAADARNACLHLAALHGEYAMTLDTDERVAWGGLDLRATLAANPTVDTWLVTTADPSGYAKERLVKLPAAGRWEGRTHEAYVEYGLRATLPYATFTEVAKTPAEYRARFERDIPLLEAEIAEHPDVPRWRSYLGETLRNLDRHEEAVAAFVECMKLHGWPEEGAWASYQAATTLGEKLDRPLDALDMCGLGLARMVTPELAWYAAYLAHKLGRQWDAINLANLATDAAVTHEARVSFRYAPAWTYKPYEVKHFAYLALGAGHEWQAEKWGSIWQEKKLAAEGA